MLEQPPAFQNLDDAEPHDIGRIELQDGAAEKLDRAAGDLSTFRPQQVRHRLQRRRFPRAVGPEKGDDALLGDIERHALEDVDDAVIVNLDILDPQYGRHGFTAWSVSCTQRRPA